MQDRIGAGGARVDLEADRVLSWDHQPDGQPNMTVDEFGRVLINEDPGGDPTPARIWSYDIASGTLTQVTEQKQVVTGETPPPGTNYTGYATEDEEVSGIIPLTNILGPGWYLTDSQIHQAFTAAEADAATAAKLVEKGQLTAVFYPIDEVDN